MNTSMKVIMTTMVILVVITNICASIWRANKLGRYVDANTGRSSERFWYLFPNSVDEDDWFDLPQWLGRMFTYVVFEREARESPFHRLLTHNTHTYRLLITLTRIAYISQNNCLHNPEHSLVPLTRNKALEYDF